MKATQSFRKGSAPGPDGLRAEHLRAATQHAPPNRRIKAEEALTKLVNTMVSGSVPDDVAPFLSGARLHAGNKKDGGLRPIAVGNILRRLTSKCSMSSVAERAAKLLGPHQLGVGVKEGLEAIIHAARQAIHEGDEDSCSCKWTSRTPSTWLTGWQPSMWYRMSSLISLSGSSPATTVRLSSYLGRPSSSHRWVSIKGTHSHLSSSHSPSSPSSPRSRRGSLGSSLMSGILVMAVWVGRRSSFRRRSTSFCRRDQQEDSSCPLQEQSLHPRNPSPQSGVRSPLTCRMIP